MATKISVGYAAFVWDLGDGTVHYEMVDEKGTVLLRGYAEDSDDAHERMCEQVSLLARANGIENPNVSLLVSKGSA